MQLSVPCTIMRGGTSKGLFFQKEDLPTDDSTRDKVILSAFGSPDPNGRQIDGLGGATSTTSKVAIVEKNKNDINSVNYTFGQVDIQSPLIDMKGNCGNLSSAVGPYAIDKGLVDRIEEPYTKVNIYNTNTDKYIVAHVPVENGKTQYEGEFLIPGVTNPGGKIQLDFMEPGGSVTGKLLPTNKPKDLLQTESFGEFEVSIVDAANPVVFVNADDVALTGIELPANIDKDENMINKLLEIRAAAAIQLDLAENFHDANVNSPAVPKMCFVAESQDYKTTQQTEMKQDDMDITARMLSMGKLHPTFAITGGVCLAVASKIEGTIVNDVVKQTGDYEVRIGHCGGVFQVGAEVIQEDEEFQARRGTAFRTARCLMTGDAQVSIK